MALSRKYGKAPFNVIVVHGGPGASGQMAAVARELSAKFGVLEPFQTEYSIRGQFRELHELINKLGEPPVKLIGHSWGACLSFIYAANYPSFVEKLILVGAGAFAEKHNSGLMKMRLDRLSEKEKAEAQKLLVLFNDPAHSLKEETFQRFGDLMSKADSFEPITLEKETAEFQAGIFQSVWKEAVALRNSGALLALGHNIQCPVIAIHGDYDPHPLKGVEEPLSQTLGDFRLIKLAKCGHYPWKERYARQKFYRILEKELNAKQ